MCLVVETEWAADIILEEDFSLCDSERPGHMKDQDFEVWFQSPPTPATYVLKLWIVGKNP